MSDLFHEDVPDEFILQVMDVIHACPQHTFQVLTRRCTRLRTWFWDAVLLRPYFPLPNLWLGVSAESGDWLDRRVPFVLDVPAAVRFVSLAPLLEDVSRHLATYLPHPWEGYGVSRDAWCETCLGVTPAQSSAWARGRRRDNHATFLDWVIVEGETGRQARPCQLDWCRRIRQVCERQDVPLFIQGVGSHCLDNLYPTKDGTSQGEPDLTRPPVLVKVPLKHPKGEDPAELPDIFVQQFPHSASVQRRHR